MTGKEMCERIVEAGILRKPDGTAPTAEEVWNSSPSGELAQVAAWYEEAVAVLAARQATEQTVTTQPALVYVLELRSWDRDLVRDVQHIASDPDKATTWLVEHGQFNSADPDDYFALFPMLVDGVEPEDRKSRTAFFDWKGNRLDAEPPPPAPEMERML